MDNTLQKVSQEVRDHILMGSDDDTSGIVDDDDDDIHPLDRDSRVDEAINNQPVVTNAGPESISININDQV